jgi:apolipoprotein N-acyltransferase
MNRPFTWIASAIFALMALAHIYRLFTHFQVVVGSHALPEWVSYVAIVVTAGLSWMLCREARGTSGP